MNHEHLTGQADRDVSTPIGGPIPAGVDGHHVGRRITAPPAPAELVAEFPESLAGLDVRALAARCAQLEVTNADLGYKLARKEHINHRLVHRLIGLRKQLKAHEEVPSCR